MKIIIKEIIHALEGRAANTDTDPRWLAATELRKLTDWDSSFCTIDVELESRLAREAIFHSSKP